MDGNDYTWNRNCLVTERGIFQYSMVLGLDIGSLQGKDILDIGAGAGLFERECSKLGINVISLDPAYSLSADPESNSPYGNLDIGKYLMVRRNRDNKITGVNEALPFRDGSFDVVLSTFSSYFYLIDNYLLERQDDVFRLFTEEVVRVLRPGGEARIGQIVYHQDRMHVLDGMIEENQSFRYEMTPLTERAKDYMILYKH